jgi:hypothetical protein
MPARATRISRVAAITGLGIPCSGWAGSPAAPADRAAAERAFALAEELGSVNAAAQELGYHLAVAAQGAHPPRPGHAGPKPRGGPPARHRRRPPPQRPTSPAGHATAGSGVHGPQPRPAPAPTRPPTRARRAATASRGDRDAQLPHRRGAQPGEPASPPLAHRHHRRRAERAQRLAGDRTGRAERRQAERAARTRHSSRAHHWPEERGMLTDAR